MNRLLLLGVLAACPLFAAKSPAQSKPLFDGQHFTDWDCDRDYWTIRDGAFVGEIKPGTQLRKNTWLVWKGGELSDFELNFQFRLTGAPGANSGVQIRCQVDNVDHVSGYQADLDMGDIWLGRIYDEHGRALLVERGSRVKIETDGQRHTQTFAPKEQYKVLFREKAWNEYRIVAVGPRIDVYVNGTLFSQLLDLQQGERDLKGQLAFQLHSGGETKIEFKDIRLETLSDEDESRLTKFELKTAAPADIDQSNQGVFPKTDQGSELDLGFESGSLRDWVSEGEAFRGQPVKTDTIASRWAGQSSQKVGDYFIGGFELLRDAPTGTITSKPFKLDQPYASFMIGGGNTEATRVEIVAIAEDGTQSPIFTAVGDNREQMRRVVADVTKYIGNTVAVRVIDENTGGWGHINFDDFRLHDTPPAPVQISQAWRSTENPLLQHLVPNLPTERSFASERPEVASTVEQMYVPEGFSCDVVAAEPIVHQPIAFTFDARGRLWIVEGHSYPQKRPAGEGLDKIVILSDKDGDGRFETRDVFAEGLNLVSGLEVGFGGVWVGAAPELLFIPDRNGDDQPDADPIVMLDGFGYGDTHETLNSFMWGPDGWLYGNQGVFNTSMIGAPDAAENQRQHLAAGVWRFHPTRREFEVFAHGGSNQWGLDYDLHGQMFMTHCRSHWGRGSTTHVMRNGHYWNQVNGGYADFISANELPGMPHLKSYLLASARYGHGEGGAGKPGSRAVYGGHSHVGTMIYLGDNWPDEYRNHLFTLNLHGHQINHQVNRREAGGYNTQHAGSDVLFCADQQFVGVDLKVGPDGAVYISDWYDPRHCHNPNTELWDRGNGRIYRMQFDATYQPSTVDYENASGAELVAALTHANHWHARTARLVLADRASTGTVDAATIASLRGLLSNHDVAIRLQAIWTLHTIGQTDQELVRYLLHDQSEYVRAWAVQLGCEALSETIMGAILQRYSESDAFTNDHSLLVRRAIASALPDVEHEAAWAIAATLLSDQNSVSDRDLPHLIWQCFAPLLRSDIRRGIQLADASPLIAINDLSLWYAARTDATGRDILCQRIADADDQSLARFTTLFAGAVAGMRNIAAPETWSSVSSRLYDSHDLQVRTSAEQIGAAFADPTLFAKLRQVATDESVDPGQRRRAIQLLQADSSRGNLDVYLALVDETEFAATALPLLARFDDSRIADKVLHHYKGWHPSIQNAALELLSSRPQSAERVLDQIAAGEMEKAQLTAYFATKMANLGNDELNTRLAKEWGRLGASSAELQDEIRKTINAYNAAPKWAFSEQQGAAHFKKLCAACHQPEQENARLAPKLEGTRTKGVEYAIENVIDPNAVIGQDFQARVILTSDGQVVTGLIQDETESAITVKTANSVVTINQDEIEEIKVSENSFMPSGLLNTLDDRERIELFKYVLSL
ncbi:PVC-type heme-binding CxxCH protein [Rhodopirellula sp. MGV]|uniref:PVC-type heme-binding CxxCH protein n=1 Tax=Rhodopirellula sp. MGV TaxID=2023130 RepID=UPI000B972C1E|nr:PVC-type heme-binding CxxCH protein [Rhodopirellula sp. MGV]OYP36593.1 hypothetical protein CGZ80_08165 [Rhodopirellula sp. MGV]PNY34569.1 DUF1080 domain-containing protein [Rhodopirellula baltica]